MTDTATQSPATKTPVAEGSDQAKPEKKERVEGTVVPFSLENLDKLQGFKPIPQSPRGGHGRKSPVDEVLDAIKGNSEAHGRPVPLVQYPKRDTAVSAYQNLKQRIGPAEATGFNFQVLCKGNDYVVVGIYDEAKVTDDGKKEWQKTLVKRRQTQAKKDAEKAAKAAAEKAATAEANGKS